MIKVLKLINRTVVVSALAVPLMLGIESATIGIQEAAAQEEGDQRKTKRVQSIRQKLLKDFEKAQEAFDAKNYSEARRFIDKIEKTEGLNNIERAYVHNYRGNMCFEQDNLSCALREFKKVVTTREGLPDSFYNQMIYVIAQVYFSQENYNEALSYAQRWFKTQADPTADAYMLVGQAQYMLKRYDAALPNVQKGIQKYVDVGSVPKEGWLNLLSYIYRQKNQYNKMLPVLKQLVQHYPKKTYLMTMAGVYNELDDQSKMTAMYQALYDQSLLTKESEIVTLAQLNMSADNPYAASEIMRKGIETGVIKKNLKHYRIYSQSLFASREYEKALAPLQRAAELSSDGKLYNQLGLSYVQLNRWREAESAKKAINKRGLSDTGGTYISLGLTQFEQKKFNEATATFNRATNYEKVSRDANNWIRYVQAEVRRIDELNAPIQEIDTNVEPLANR